MNALPKIVDEHFRDVWDEYFNDCLSSTKKIVMPDLLAIDPGTRKSGYVFFEGGKIYQTDTEENKHIINAGACPAIVVIEWPNLMGLPAGQDVFHTCREIGRMQQAFIDHRARYYEDEGAADVHFIQRNDVKLMLTGRTVGITDAVIRQRLIDLFPPTGGGRVPQIGTKNERGPLYNVKGHAWQALGAGVAWVLMQSLQLGIHDHEDDYGDESWNEIRNARENWSNAKRLTMKYGQNPTKEQ